MADSSPVPRSAHLWGGTDALCVRSSTQRQYSGGMSAPESPIPLSAVGLRLTDEVGQAVLDWVATGDLSASAALDQHVAAVRAGLAGCPPDDASAARLAGYAAGRAARSKSARSGAARSAGERSDAPRSDAARSDAPRSDGARPDAPRSDAQRSKSAQPERAQPEGARAEAARPHHARRKGVANEPDQAEPAAKKPAVVAPGCPDVPFADSAWYADDALPVRLLLHYACGFVEAAVRADWWPAESDTPPGAADFEELRLGAVCRLIRQAETAAALPPDLR
jgi:Family of unknown function (DUF6401)